MAFFDFDPIPRPVEDILASYTESAIKDPSKIRQAAEAYRKHCLPEKVMEKLGELEQKVGDEGNNVITFWKATVIDLDMKNPREAFIMYEQLREEGFLSDTEYVQSMRRAGILDERRYKLSLAPNKSAEQWAILGSMYATSRMMKPSIDAYQKAVAGDANYRPELGWRLWMSKQFRKAEAQADMMKTNEEQRLQGYQLHLNIAIMRGRDVGKRIEEAERAFPDNLPFLRSRIYFDSLSNTRDVLETALTRQDDLREHYISQGISTQILDVDRLFLQYRNRDLDLAHENAKYVVTNINSLSHDYLDNDSFLSALRAVNVLELRTKERMSNDLYHHYLRGYWIKKAVKFSSMPHWFINAFANESVTMREEDEKHGEQPPPFQSSFM